MRPRPSNGALAGECDEAHSADVCNELDLGTRYCPPITGSLSLAAPSRITVAAYPQPRANVCSKPVNLQQVRLHEPR